VDMLAGLDRRDEVLAMQVLRRGNQDGINGRVFQQVPVVQVGLRLRRDRGALLETFGIDVGETGELRVGALERGSDQRFTARSIADDAEPDTILGSRQAGALERGSGRTEEEGSSIIHVMPS